MASLSSSYIVCAFPAFTRDLPSTVIHGKSFNHITSGRYVFSSKGTLARSCNTWFLHMYTPMTTYGSNQYIVKPRPTFFKTLHRTSQAHEVLLETDHCQPRKRPQQQDIE
jgi:hypothetical protein